MLPGSPSPLDHFEADLEVIAAVTDRGLRHPDNQDAFALETNADRAVWVVCDGVSSSARPDEAAAAAARAAIGALSSLLGTPEWPDPDAIVAALQAATAAAEQAVVDLAAPRDPVSATTIVLGAVGPDVAVVGGIGDSRIYWVDSGSGPDQQLTVDDSLAQEAIDDGMSPEEAFASPGAHTITQCLRTDTTGPTLPTVAIVEVRGPGLLVACSDGLWNYLERPEAIAAAVASSPDPTPIGIARHLVDVANRAGGGDNITVAVVPVDPGGVVDPAGVVAPAATNTNGTSESTGVTRSTGPASDGPADRVPAD